MKYKLIASDLDGTLNNDNFIVSQENIAAIKKARDAGIMFVLCSGRSPASLQVYEQKLGLNVAGNFGIGFNGSTVYDSHTKKTIFGDFIEKDTAINIVQTIKRLEKELPKAENQRTSLQAIYLTNNLMIAENGLQDALKEYNQEGVITINYVDQITPEHITDNCLNMYCINYHPALLPLYDALQKESLVGCDMAITSQNLLEFLPTSMNKAQGIARLCQHLGITMDQVVTVGDNYNDLEMIEQAGFGVAVANAVPALQDIAKYVTKRNNNMHAMEEVVDKVIEMNKG